MKKLFLAFSLLTGCIDQTATRDEVEDTANVSAELGTTAGDTTSQEVTTPEELVIHPNFCPTCTVDSECQLATCGHHCINSSNPSIPRICGNTES